MGILCLEFNKPDHPLLTLHPWKACVWPGTANFVEDTPQDLLKETLFGGQSCFFDIIIDSQVELSRGIPSINKDLPSDNEQECLVLEDGISSLLLEENKDLDLLRVSRCILERNEIMETLSNKLIELLQKSIKKRISNLPEPQNLDRAGRPTMTKSKLAILFSGGLDSTVIAALADR